MHFSSNYEEFYQKALIPMGQKDRTTLQDSGSELTHWLVALEGHPRAGDVYYLWEAAIYPANNQGFFNHFKPLYKSSRFECFDEAYEAARSIEKLGRNDDLSSLDIKEKIS